MAGCMACALKASKTSGTFQTNMQDDCIMQLRQLAGSSAPAESGAEAVSNMWQR